MTSPTHLVTVLQQQITARRGVAALMRELGEHMGRAARDPANVVERPCPVCASTDVDPEVEVRGPVYTFRRCRGCTLLYSPRVFRHEVTRRLYGERPIYRAYWEYMRADAEAMRGREVYGGLIARLLAVVPGRDAVIDVGCGFGKLAAELQPHFREVIGLELNRRTARAGAELFGVTIRAERLERLARPDGSVDLVVMNNVLEHLTDIHTLVEAALRVLRPGGILYASIPHGASIGMRVLGGAHRFVATHVHLNMFTARALRRLAVTSGFRVRTLGATDGLDLSAADWILERWPERGLLAAPALVIDGAARRAASWTAWPSRLGVGSHLEAILEKPSVTGAPAGIALSSRRPTGREVEVRP